MSTCPTNDTAFKERSEKKNCNILSTCAGKPLVYHCVLSEGMIVEVCAPRTLITGIWIAIAHIGIFNTILHVFKKKNVYCINKTILSLLRKQNDKQDKCCEIKKQIRSIYLVEINFVYWAETVFVTVYHYNTMKTVRHKTAWKKT